MSMTNENEALRRFDDALKRIDALEEQIARAIQRINALEALCLTSSAELANLGITLGDPSP
jgi:chromosome segregation ATPase